MLAQSRRYSWELDQGVSRGAVDRYDWEPLSGRVAATLHQANVSRRSRAGRAVGDRPRRCAVTVANAGVHAVAKSRHFLLPALIPLLVSLLLAACGTPSGPASPGATAARSPLANATGQVAPPTPVPTEPATAPRATVPPSTSAGATTTIVDYLPERPAGEPLAAACWTNSLVVPSRAAWRCELEGRSLEPCFVLEPGSLVCSPNPLTGEKGVLVQLSQPLPRPDLIAEKPDSAWLLQLADGTACSLLPGATGLVDGKRISYTCATGATDDANKVVLLGDPKQGSTWSVEKATVAAKDGKYVATTSATLAVRTVVRAPSIYTPYACGRLAGAVGAVLGVDLKASEGSFLDPSSGEKGSGCQLSASWPGAGPVVKPAEAVGWLLSGQEWQEDPRYRNAQPGRSASAYRKGGELCLIDAGWPAEGATPTRNESPGYSLKLACARDRSAGTVGLLFRAPERITFPYMGTAGTASGQIAAGQIREYVLTVFAKQTMILNLHASAPDVYLSVTGWDDDASLLRPAAGATNWYGVLPSRQDYLITVAARGQAAQFGLDVIIPEDLVVAPGGAAIALPRQLPAGQPAHYLLAAEAGQRLTVSLEASEGRARLALRGLDDGQEVVPASADAASWSGTLARRQPYLLEVTPVAGPAQYTLRVSAN
jgi:hypothetical protein